jgi:hypothetical protein
MRFGKLSLSGLGLEVKFYTQRPCQNYSISRALPALLTAESQRNRKYFG